MENQSIKYLPQPTKCGNLHKASVREFETKKGTKGVGFTLVEQRVYKDKDGNKVEEDEFYHNCVAYGNDAEIIIAAAKEVGVKISFIGYSKKEEWTNEAGEKRYNTKVTARFVKPYRWNAETKMWDLQELVDASESQAVGGKDDLPF